MNSKKLFRAALFGLTILFVLVASVFTNSSRSAAQGGGLADASGIWRVVDESRLPAAPAGTRIIIPARYRTVALGTTSLRTLLTRAPMEFTLQARTGRVEINLPTPDGKFARFRAEESPIMEPALAAKHPGIKTYRAQGVDDPAATARFGVTPYGLHAIVLSPSGTYYIDPYRQGDAVNHISYFKRDYLFTDAHRFECKVHKRAGGFAPTGLTAESASAVEATRPNGGTLRTYRLALAADFEYSDFHSDDTIPDKAEVLAQGIIPAVNRVTGIYEREVAVKMVLVANEEMIIFNTPADPYVNENGQSMLATNQATCDAAIGPLNYDIGHVVSTGGGGVAFLGVVCSVQKAGGVTGLPAPTGDPFFVDYVAHEMGHQFGGNHTFNGSSGSCAGGNRNAGTAYEVGSGTTIQAYAGICSPQNVQPNSDDYFHTASYDEILTHITTEATCSVNTQTGNNPPTIEAGPDFNIPARTPFTLSPTSSGDTNGDTLTYDWEEFDLGPAGDGRADNGTSPIFRSFKPTLSPSRPFPKLSDQLGNTTTYGELLPTTTRTMNFRVTVRDNRTGGGGVEYDSMKVNVTSSAGPFLVSAPNGGETWNTGETQSVTWDVAGTSAAPISAANVNIHLSTDGGQTFPVTLATNTPNDGSHNVVVPSVATVNARVRVSAAGNIFYDLSNADFNVNPPPLPPVAVNDAATTAFQTPVFIPVLANDSDDASPLSIVSVQSPTNVGGTASVDDNGTPGNTADDRVLYAPPPQFSGPDQFGYTISDGGSTASATVTVTVNSFCPPTPTGSFLATFEAGGDGFTVQTPANAPASPPWTRVADPAAHSPAMSFFTDNAAVAGAQKSDRLISPPQLISSTSKLIFYHRFSLEPDYDGGVLEVSTNGGASFTDITNIGVGDEFISGGYNRLMGNGPLATRMAWSGESPDFLTPAMNKVEVNLGALAGQTAVFRWHFRADDLNADEAVGWWVDDIEFTNLLVSSACNEPPFAVSQSVTTNEDTPLGITLTALQGDDTDPLTFTVQSGPAHGTLTGSAPNLTYTPAANYDGADSFTFTASDGTNTSNVATVSITVLAVNDPPLVSDDTATVFEDSGPNAVDVLRNDSPAQAGGTLSIQSVTQGASGAVAITDGGSLLTYAPNTGFSGTDNFTYTATDGAGGTATANVRVTVVDINGPVNYALTALGSVPSASSVYTSRNYSVTSAFDGDNTGNGWEQGGGWNDATRDVWPDSLSVAFGGGAKTINEIRVYTLQNNFNAPVVPDANTDASLYGIQDFEVQVFNTATGQFETVPVVGTITGNTKALRVITLAQPVTTTAVRIVVNMGRAHYSRIVELEAYGGPGQ
ncbi:MAG: tandem-95 repeat protein [Rubrivivax sp.]|nr:tandem-95 repeat protein [Pyrinomonadaceae bacterium]